MRTTKSLPCSVLVKAGLFCLSSDQAHLYRSPRKSSEQEHKSATLQEAKPGQIAPIFLSALQPTSFALIWH